MAPTAMQKIGGVLAIAWPDGVEHYLDVARLRASCPCAACQGETDVTGRTFLPARRAGPGSTELTGWQFVGGYGWQPRWADGHSSGIYTFEALRRLGEETGS